MAGLILAPYPLRLTPFASAAAALWALNTYDAKVVEVVDGDNIKVIVAIWIDNQITPSIRLRGIDTPEKNGKCPREIELAEQAKALTAMMVAIGRVRLSNVGPDKYNRRYLADVTLRDGRKLSAVLISEGLARRYNGKKKSDWCALPIVTAGM